MITTIEIDDSILLQAKRLAASRRTAVRALVEQGLRRVIADEQRDAGFKFEPVTDKRPARPGNPPAMPWEQVRELIYGGRGA